MTQKTRSTLLIAIGASIISFSAVFVKLAAVPADVAGFYRVLSGSVILLVLVLVRREKLYHGPRSLAYT
ncbi:MAG: hypothetical protein ACRCUT_01840, partial [Spirochaetota bacterium]